MKGVALVLFTLLGAALQAQRTVQTIVPLQPIAVGSAFQVQYIVTDGEPVVELQSPAFGRDFRFVSGPRLYHGEALINNTKTPIQNFSYTLVPLRKGRLVVKGATLVFSSGKHKSDDTFVVVTDKSNNDPLHATPVSNLPRLAPGDNWNKKVAEQIFIKTAVSKKNCFVGEPVEATFTLFSRLPSASEVLKNPGFYGFSVLDMPDATEGTQTVQTHDGAFYNTHTLRHVQLYPAQPGNLLLDKMSVTNAIEYADSASGAPVQTTVLLESELATIAVKPLPATTVQNFSGAVGRFSVNAWLDKPEWPQSSNGKLMVTVSGSGNFLQLSAPEIRWPNDLDVFEPTVTERLQNEVVPVSGTRTYTYAFTTGGTGRFSIPPVTFTYFNPAEKRYVTARTDSLYFTVREAQLRSLFPARIRKQPAGSRSYTGWIAGAFIVISAGVFVIMKRNVRRKEIHTAPPETGLPDFEKTIQLIDVADSDKYRQLQQALMGFLKSWYPQVEVSKHALIQQVASRSGHTPEEARLQPILDECEAVQYYNAAPTVPFTDLQQQALRFVRSLKGQ